MAGAIFFLAPVAVSAVVTAIAVLALRRPLSDMVAELCGSRQRGNFWVTLGSLCMVLAAISASTFPDETINHPSSDVPFLLRDAVLQAASGLAGVLISLFVVAGALFLFIRRFEQRFRSASSRPEASVPPVNR